MLFVGLFLSLLEPTAEISTSKLFVLIDVFFITGMPLTRHNTNNQDGNNVVICYCYCLLVVGISIFFTVGWPNPEVNYKSELEKRSPCWPPKQCQKSGFWWLVYKSRKRKQIKTKTTNKQTNESKQKQTNNKKATNTHTKQQDGKLCLICLVACVQHQTNKTNKNTNKNTNKQHKKNTNHKNIVW